MSRALSCTASVGCAGVGNVIAWRGSAAGRCARAMWARRTAAWRAESDTYRTDGVVEAQRRCGRTRGRVGHAGDLQRGGRGRAEDNGGELVQLRRDETEKLRGVN